VYLNSVLDQLQRRLEEVPLELPLPSSSQIVADLQSQVMHLMADAWRDVGGRCQNFASIISLEVEKSLRQVRIATTLQDHGQIFIPQMPAFDIAPEPFEEAWTGLFTGGLFGLVVGGPLGVLLALGGLLTGAILGRERRRKREIKRVVDHSRTSLMATFGSGHAQVREKIRLFLSSLEHHVTDRISVFVYDVERQLAKLGSPVAPEEQRCMQAREEAVRGCLATLNEVVTVMEADSRNPSLPGE
jgi:hypothetical protein